MKINNTRNFDANEGILFFFYSRIHWASNSSKSLAQMKVNREKFGSMAVLKF